jgi:hypothetical protein
MNGGRIGVGEPTGFLSGAQVELYSGRYGSVNVVVAAIPAEIVGQAGGWNNPKFQKTDINLLNAELRAFGAGVEVNVQKIRDNGFSVSFDGGIVAAGNVAFSFPSIDPRGWGMTSNG